ncbi:MAG: indole-3-glycerol phosphate synthase TrpC [Armatimonadota bacterium]|nr:indole-3-glycerol phosphate synthase TrpC [Armatimonadota bacterium]MDR7451031.1 indole-3-glycerol phosphate synthase TrpC [Armatimonadota bacterium]MDR7465948.1 indole-3-glycerol phosphate synthase TrpC [Armatimonadota bacterium]MDR7494013.1 indole-3-glycerol phosphate synthase TrpC [Armatimonadota bacterium]MDR7498463.1 indole-3-glycerol phosphate synthase TrpC [Armatimonadota bacterium]
MILDEILAYKQQEVLRRAAVRSPREVAAAAATAPAPPDFLGALRGRGLAVIAEIKGASPSAGTIRAAYDPVAVAAAYEAGGAAALSVLTDAKYFRGSWEALGRVARSTRLPVLCKEFIVDPYQIDEARAAGAAAVLLIAAATPGRRLRAYLEHARRRGLDALVEVHTAREVAVALEAGAEAIGINNRDLRTLEVDLETTARLRPLIPPGVVVVSESGFASRAEVEAVMRLGVDAILVGTNLMRSPDPGAALRTLRGEQ